MEQTPLPPQHPPWFFLLWLGSQKDHPWRREAVKGALMVMYSCVALYCHPQMLLTHADNPVTTKIIHHFSSSCQVTPGCHTPASRARLAESHLPRYLSTPPPPRRQPGVPPDTQLLGGSLTQTGHSPPQGGGRWGTPPSHSAWRVGVDPGSQRTDALSSQPCSLPRPSSLPPPLPTPDPSPFTMGKKWDLQGCRGACYFLGMARRGKHRRKQKLYYYCF